MGTLLNEPNQNFGYHLNETIAFFVQETEDKKVICYSDMTPSMKLTADSLIDIRLKMRNSLLVKSLNISIFV